MIVLLITIILVGLWVSYEVWRAPMFDDKMNLIRDERNLKDLLSFLKKNK